MNKELKYKDISGYPAWSQSLAIGEWFQQGGYNQLEINVTKTCGSDPTFKDDLLGYTLEYFLSLPVEKQVKIYDDNAIEQYLTRLAAISLKSSTSPFYSKYRKFLMNAREVTDWTPVKFHEEYSEEVVECKACKCIQDAISTHGDWYEKRLLEMSVLDEMKPAAIAQELNLDTKSVTSNISVAKKKIAKQCKHLLESNKKKKKKNA